MLVSLEKVRGYQVVAARKADLGPMDEVYFDDREWKIRFFIVRTSRFLGRDVLIAPEAVAWINDEDEQLALKITRKQVEGSPPVDFAKTVSQQEVERYYGYYGWPYYWGVPAPWTVGMVRPHEPPPPPDEAEAGADPHLRSLGEVTGYRIQGLDDDIGHLEDMVVDVDGWTIRYLVVDTRNWWPGKRVLLLPGSVSAFDWHLRQVLVGVQRDVIKEAPEWERERPLTREDERRIHAHYGIAPYWTEPALEVPAPAP
jgi:hypothetical protein